MKVILITLFSFLVINSCRKPDQSLYTRKEISEFLSSFEKPENLKRHEDFEEVILLTDQKLYNTYFVKLDNGAYCKLSGLSDLRYLYEEFYTTKNYAENTFFYDVLNLKREISAEFIESSLKKNMVDGIVFSINDKIFQEYKNVGIQALINNYTVEGKNKTLLITGFKDDLNTFYTVVYLFYINGYKYNFDEYSGFGVIQKTE